MYSLIFFRFVAVTTLRRCYNHHSGKVQATFPSRLGDNQRQW
ncbi:hypothetical protein [Salinivibrio costicola]|nr:hypothetical protein [Salinivibrio costicola]